MFLYWGSGSPPCWKVMLTLEEKGLSGYGNKLVSFAKKEHKADDVLKLNPRGQVPTFTIGNMVINESGAACDYLEDIYRNQGTKLLPEDSVSKALVLQRKYETMNLHKKGTEELIHYLWRTKAEDQDPELLKTKKSNLSEELFIWEGYLEKLGNGSHIAGKDFSMADIAFFPTLAFMVRVGLPIDKKYPRLASYYHHVCERPSVKVSWPPRWKESPNPTLLADL